VGRTLSHEFVALIRGKSIGDSDLHQAALYTLDAIANTVGGRNSLPGKLLCQWGEEHHGDAARQAFVMAGLTHILETDDLHRASVTHPGCVVVPTVLALGARQKVSGRTLLTAVLHGFAAACPDAVPSAVIADADADWQLRQTSIKPWPSCRHTHPAIDAALADGHVEFDSFSGESRARLSALRRKVTVQAGEPYKSAYPDKYWGAAVSVTTTSGDPLSEQREACKGDPEAALSDTEMFSKAATLFDHGGMEPIQSKALIETVMELVEDKVDWGLLESVFPGEIRK
jgi:2-methylcitrate dehydratase PrpD